MSPLRAGEIGSEGYKGGIEFVVVLGNCNARKRLFATLEVHPRWNFQLTPTHAFWLNQIELFFSILSRRLLRRGIFTNEEDLRAQLLSFIQR